MRAACGRRTGTLSSRQRDALPGSAFGLPATRQYPMPDESHAKNAKARAAQQLRAGNLSTRDYTTIVNKADRIIAACDGGDMAKKRKKATKKRRKKATKRKTKKKTAKRKTKKKATKKRAKRKTAKRKTKKKATKRKTTKKRSKKKATKAAPKKKTTVDAALKAAIGPRL